MVGNCTCEKLMDWNDVAPEVALLLCDVIATSPRGAVYKVSRVSRVRPNRGNLNFSHVHITLNTVQTTS